MKLDTVISLSTVSNSTDPVVGVRARLVWDSTDPLLVAVTFLDGCHPGGVVTSDALPMWVIGRDLLASGGGSTEQPSCVTVWRSASWFGAVLRDVQSPTTFTIVWVESLQLDEFLRRTYRVVQAGDEVTEQQVDEFIADCGRVTP